MSVHITSMIWRARLGNAVRKGVAMKLGDCADDRGGNCYPSVDRIAAEAEVGERTVQRTLREFQHVGLLTLDRAGGGRGHTSRYRFDMGLLRRLADGEIEMVGSGAEAALVPMTDKPADADKGCQSDTVSQTPNGDSVAPFEEETPPASAVNPATVAPEPSRTVRVSLPLPPLASGHARERADATVSGSGHPGDHPIGTCVPIERMAWIDALRADGACADVVDRLIAPLLATLTVPRDVAPVAWLRVWRDAVAQSRPTAAVLDKLRAMIAIDRVRDLPWPRDLAAMIDRAEAALQVTLPAGDPRWRAWLDHDLRDPSKAAFARAVERNGWPYQADGDWPPGHAQTTGGTE